MLALEKDDSVRRLNAPADHMPNVSSFFLANLSCKAYNKIIAGGTPGIAFKRFLEERVATHFIK